MATVYCWRCRECGAMTTNNTYDVPPAHNCSGASDVVRDYQRENVGINIDDLKRARDVNGVEAARDLFLPTAKEYESASDPTGQKGLREWAERHQPAASNKKPAWPAMDKAVF